MEVCLLGVKMAVISNPNMVVWVATVARLRGSEKLSINGIVPIVQSQHKSLGRNSSLKLTAAR